MPDDSPCARMEGRYSVLLSPASPELRQAAKVDGIGCNRHDGTIYCCAINNRDARRLSRFLKKHRIEAEQAALDFLAEMTGQPLIRGGSRGRNRFGQFAH